MPDTTILFRSDVETEEELSVAREYFKIHAYRTDIPDGSLVLRRYSVLPYYAELEAELRDSKGAKMINSWAEHSFIADANLWSCPGGVLDSRTPRTWVEWGSLPSNTSFVLKGKTNSRKHQWKTHMFAETKEQVPLIARRLLDDTLIREQGLIVREYLPLKRLGEGLNGLPITNEWRTFWYVEEAGDAKLLTSGFYWASHPECEAEARFPEEALQFAEEAARLFSPHARFFVLDVAETTRGEWSVIEVNDAQMSGLSLCSARELYSNLRECLSRKPRG